MMVAVFGGGHSGTAQVRYSIRPLPTDSLLHLRIATTFTGEADGVTRFALPDDRFGVASLHRWVRDVEAGPNVRLAAREPGVYEVSHEPRAEVQVVYTVAYDPNEAGFKPFGPSVDAHHFHFFGAQWMARVGAEKGAHEVVRSIEVEFDDTDWDGAWASSYGVGPGPHRIQASDYDLDYSVVAGGAYRTATAQCQGRPVLTAVHGDFAIADETVFALTDSVVCGQRSVFSDFDHPFFTVFITERDDLEAGAPLLHGFTAFLDPGASEEELRWLLAHEMIHTWLPRSARVFEAEHPDAPESRTRWFHEGFTEYLARLTLVKQGLLPRSWMVEQTNEDLRRLAYQPYRTLTLDELDAATQASRYNGVHHRLHYVRGALLALNWDARIRRASEGEHSLVDPIRALLREARANDGAIEIAALSRLFESFGVDAAADIERYLEGGVLLPPELDAFAPDYALRSEELPRFEPGFDVVHWIESGAIVDLKPGGTAERAGLREGMRIRRRGNAAPWHGRWDPSQPIILIVGEDEPRRFEFSATGPSMQVPVFVAVDESSSD
ncbi:MAG: hypothetical protein HKN04_10740 [Rhodothermaceae bacterium]|nr:hypothetical protein [Rhodothermaceae bacterium]